MIDINGSHHSITVDQLYGWGVDNSNDLDSRLNIHFTIKINNNQIKHLNNQNGTTSACTGDSANASLQLVDQIKHSSNEINVGGLFVLPILPAG